MKPPFKRTASLMALAILVATAVVLATFWRSWLTKVARDSLESALGCSVELSTVDLTKDGFDLHGLGIHTCKELPQLIAADVSRLSVIASLAEVRRGRFPRVTLGSMAIRLSTASAEVSTDLVALPDIGELVFDKANIVVHDNETRAELGSLEVSAELTELATALLGEISVVARRISFSTLTQLVGFESELDFEIQDLAISIRPALSKVTVQASAAHLAHSSGLVISGPEIDARIDLPSIQLDIVSQSSSFEIDGASVSLPTMTWQVEASANPNRFEIEARAEPSSIFDSIGVEASWNPAAETDPQIEAHLAGLRIERILPRLGLEGTLTSSLTAQDGSSNLEVRISPVALSREDVGLDIALSANSTLDARLDLDEVSAGYAGNLSARFTNFEPRGQISGWLLPAELSASGLLQAEIHSDPAGNVGIRLTNAEASLGPLGRLSSTATIELGESKEAFGELIWTTSDLSTTLAPDRLASVETSVPFTIDGGSARFRAAFDTRSSIRLAGSAAVEDLSITVNPEGAEGPRFGLLDTSVSTDWSLDLETSRLRFKALRGQTLTTLPLIAGVPITVTGASGIARKNHVELNEAKLDLGHFGTLSLSVAWEEEAMNMGLDADALPVEPWIRAFQNFEGIDLSGFLRLELDAHQAPDASWVVDSHVGLLQLGSSSSDGSRVLEGLSGEFDVTVTSSPPALAADGRLSGFLVLWDELFVDFSELGTSLEASASLDEAGWSFDASATWPHDFVGHLSALGSGSSLRAHTVRADISIADLGVYRETFFPDLPFDLGGKATLDLDGRHLDTSNWQLDGRIALDNVDVIGRQDVIELRGLDLDLPLAIESDFATESPDPNASNPTVSGDRGGWIQFESLRFRDLRLASTASTLAVGRDWIRLDQPLEVELFGGIVRLQHIHASSLYSEQRRMEASVSLLGADLERLTTDLQLFPLRGGLDLDLPRIVVDRDRLVADGGGRAALLGGEVEIHDISGERIFSRFPAFTFSADFNDVDLHRLTETLDLGVMTGRLDGAIRRCTLFRGVPVRFDATLETTTGKGIQRYIDVEAVNNLSILGTGSSLEFLNSGIRRFFSRYTYERLAVDVELARDVLLLRGREKRGDRELFLRGRLPFPIDIVNAQPGRTVSFETMTRRLRSLGQ